MVKPALPYFVSTAVTDIVNWTVLSLVLISLTLRLVFRKWVVPKLGLDDVYICFSVAFGLAFIIIMHFESQAYENLYGILIKLPPAQVTPTHSKYSLKQFAIGLNLSFYDNATQTISVTLSKMALISFYRRLTKVKLHHIVLYVLDGILVLNCIWNCLIFLFTTTPIDCFFHLDYYGSPANCEWNIDPLAAVIASCAVQIFIDIALCALPWAVLWRMQLSRADKVKLVAIYSVGLTSMACSAARMWSLDSASLGILEVMRGQFIFTFTTMLEAFAAIICANVPIMAGGFLKLHKKGIDSNRIVYYQSSENRAAQSDMRLASAGKSRLESYDAERSFSGPNF